MSPSPIYFTLVLHFHQPVGNFHEVFARAHDLAYKPLLDHLLAYPDIPVGLHFSGCLLDWLLAHRPEIRVQVQRLVDRGQAEILTGGYYEPILPMLRPEDAQGQVRMHNRAVEDLWSVRPTGLWLTERVWEPQLPSWLAPLGIRYSLVDDNHLHRAGQHHLAGTWLTEDCGHPLRLLVNLKPLRRLIPWQPLDTVWAMLGELAAQGRDLGIAPLACLGDDAERFGLWPRTHEHCWEQGYMRRLFDGLLERRDWITPVTPSAYMRRHADQGRVYLPTASYLEMMDWAMPSDEATILAQHRRDLEGRDVSRFLSGGFWRNFLVKYPEVNWLQKRGMDLSRALDGLEAEQGGRCEALDEGRRRVWASQCNCAYWHGVFGGVYLTHLRQANAANLLAAQEEAGLWPSPYWSARDVDLDGLEEVQLRLGPWQVFLCPELGGVAKELDYLPKRLNLATAFARRPEPYHQALRDAARNGEVITPDHPQWQEFFHIHSAEVRAKEAGLENHLHYDDYQRLPFADFVLPPGFNLQEMALSGGEALGSSWQTPMQWRVGETQPDALHAELTGTMRLGPEDANLLHVRKIFELHDRILDVRYVLRMEQGTVDAVWLTQVDLGLTGQCVGRTGVDVRAVQRELDQPWSMSEVAEVVFSCPYTQGSLVVQVQPPMGLDHVPLWAVTKSENGFERTPQGSACAFSTPLQLQPGQEECFQFSLRFEE